MPEEPTAASASTDPDETVGGVGVIIPGNGETYARPLPATPAASALPKTPTDDTAAANPSAAEIEADTENGFLAGERAEEAPAEAALLAAAARPDAAPVASPTQAAFTPPPLVTLPPPAADRGSTHGLVPIILGGILGALLALLILLLINGSLDYSQHERILLITSDVATLQRDMTEVRAVAGKTAERVSTAEDSLGELGATLAAQGEAIGALEQQITALDQNLAQAAVDADERLTALDGSLADAGERMGVLESEVMNQGETVVAISADVGAIDEEVVGIQDVLVTVEGTLQQLANKGITLQEAVDTISARIVELDGTARRFDTFVDRLRETLIQISDEADAPAAAVESPAVVVEAPTAGPDDEAPAIETPAPISAEPFTQTPTLQRFPPANPIPYPEPDQSHIFGLVYDDRNKNGIADQGDKGLPGITVILRDPSDREVASAITDADGRYLFANVRPGFYFVVEVDAAGTSSITPNYVTISARPNRLIEVNFADQVN